MHELHGMFNSLIGLAVAAYVAVAVIFLPTFLYILISTEECVR